MQQNTQHTADTSATVAPSCHVAHHACCAAAHSSVNQGYYNGATYRGTTTQHQRWWCNAVMVTCLQVAIQTSTASSKAADMQSPSSRVPKADSPAVNTESATYDQTKL